MHVFTPFRKNEQIILRIQPETGLFTYCSGTNYILKCSKRLYYRFAFFLFVQKECLDLITVLLQSKQQADIEAEAVKEWILRDFPKVFNTQSRVNLLFSTDFSTLTLSLSLFFLDFLNCHRLSLLSVACLLPHLFSLFILCHTDDVSDVCFMCAVYHGKFTVICLPCSIIRNVV